MRSVELFAGAGGMAYGIAMAGFKHDIVIEKDRNACSTIKENKERGLKHIEDWELFSDDICNFDYTSISPGVDLLSGGPPCQPFSIGGKHKGSRDRRNMFPEAARAVRMLAPRAFIFENVQGLARQSFAKYFEYIRLQLTYPEISLKEGEDWGEHLVRLERHHTGGRYKGLYYRVVSDVLNAADFGIPQKRKRVFIVGFRSDIRLEWNFPEATHSQENLLFNQWVSGEYWERHKVSKRQRPDLPLKLKTRIEHLKQLSALPPGRPWLTVRDAISDLPDPERIKNCQIYRNHNFNPGARIYKGHTGSPYDKPAKTLKAGDHGVPGGENMLTRLDGSVRYFTVRECARLQTFPDEFSFMGSWTEAMRQLGNAVPVNLAHILACSIREKLTCPNSED